jgi:hypothetical protein
MCDLTAGASAGLPFDRSAPKVARGFVISNICKRHFPDIDDALLLTSETVTNAVQHGWPPLSISMDCDAVHAGTRAG